MNLIDTAGVEVNIWQLSIQNISTQFIHIISTKDCNQVTGS